jgi:myo-inositol-1(or 4)-monophosphatase
MSAPPSLDELLYVAKESVELAATIAREQREQYSASISFKGSRNLVTSADIAAEQAIITRIQETFPDHAILAEESTSTTSPQIFGSGYVWVIDPIDGTTNYAHGHPHVGISIACALDGIIQIGVVAAPFYGEVFTAVKGRGAFLNGKAIHCATTATVEDALITTGIPYDRSNVHNICCRIERVIARCRDLRRLGAASLDLCWVACGRLDAYFEEGLSPWDIAAGRLIAGESGATISHYDYDHPSQRRTQEYPGELFADNLVAATPLLLPKLLATLNEHTSS